MQLPSSPPVDQPSISSSRRWEFPVVSSRQPGRGKEGGRLLGFVLAAVGVVLLGGVAVVSIGSEKGEPERGARMQALSEMSLGGKSGGFPMAYLQKLSEDGGDGNSTDSNATEASGKAAAGTCKPVPAHDAFYVKQIFWSWVNTLEVSAVVIQEDGNETTQSLGHIKSVPFSFESAQTWKDKDGRIVASSYQDVISTVTHVYVEDCDHDPIATISEQFSPGSSAVSQYTIQNGDGDIVAISTMSRNWGTEVDINDQQSGKRLVTVSKGWGQIQDAWAAKFREGMPENLANDPRVVVMLLSAASNSGSWGLGGPLGILLNPLWLLLLFCCCCACCTAMTKAGAFRRDYEQIPPGYGGPFPGQGYTTGYGSSTGFAGSGTQYV